MSEVDFGKTTVIYMMFKISTVIHVRQGEITTVSAESSSNKLKNYLPKLYSKNGNVLYTIPNISLQFISIGDPTVNF